MIFIVLADVNLFNVDSDAPFWTLLGVLLGGLMTGFVNHYLQKGQFRHNKEMFYLQNQSREFVKEVLLDALNHKIFVGRSFATMRKRIGGYTDDELRIILHEIEAKKSSNQKGEEVWYLKDRQEEWDSRGNK